ncbi:MAG: serine/threonine-protein kinase [Pseudonocardiaceae bacterium]
MPGAGGQLPDVGSGVPELPGYRIERQLGRGSMGVVYLAEDTKLRRKVALKVLAPTLADDELFRKRFDRESQSAANLDHPNIVPVYTAGEAAGSLYIAMRYVAGGDLRALLEARGPLSLEQTTSIVASVAQALDAAHAQGMIHRDVKPANILIDSQNGQEHYYLSDFGITKIVSSGRSLTSTGQIIGTIDYIAPEQIQGKPVDGRADLYALGCVLHQCLTGVVPFPREETAALMWAHVHDEPSPVTAHRPDLPAQIDRIVATAMAKQPENRYSTCRDLALALRAIVNDPSSSADGGQAVPPAKPIDGSPSPVLPTSMTGTYIPPPRPAHARASKTPGRKWQVIAAGGLLALVLIGGSVTGVVSYLDSQFPNDAEQQLLNVVPLALTTKNSCTRNAAAEQDTANVAASVVCTSDADANKVVFTKFTSSQAMDNHYQAAVATAGIPESSGDCRSAGRAEGTFRNETGRTSGRSLCYQDRGSSFVEWTDDQSHLLAQATRVDPDYAKLRDWWAGVVGLKLPSTSTSEPTPAPASPPAAAAPAAPAPAPQPEPRQDPPQPPAQGGDRSSPQPRGSGKKDDQSGGQGRGSGQNSPPQSSSESSPETPPSSTTPPSSSTTPPSSSTTPPSSSTTPPSSTTNPPTSTTPKPPPVGITLDGPAPSAPEQQEGGSPVPGKGGCSTLAGYYSCPVTRTAPIYLPGTSEPRGQLPASKSVFVCQSDGSNYSVGKRTSHWWAWVGNGPLGVWVPTLFLAGARDNAAEPGLPVCGSLPTVTEQPTTAAPPTTLPIHLPTHPVHSILPPETSGQNAPATTE